MKLQEEYLSRHGIKIPIVYHTRNAHLILKIRTRPQIILEITWKSHPRRPGHYLFRYLSPVHDAWKTGEYFEEMDSSYICQYQDYVSYIKRWAANLDFQPVTETDLDVAIFEMFLYCFDSWISEKPKLLEAVFKVVEAKNNKDFYLTEFLGKLRFERDAFTVYQDEFLRFKLDYAGWLVKLIKT